MQPRPGLRKHPGLLVFWGLIATMETLMDKLILPATKPRNPLVAPSLQRKAGPHRARKQPSRQQAARALQRALSGTVASAG